VTSLRTLLDDDPEGRPTKVTSKPVSQMTVRDIPEGTSYFHLQLRTDDGWGPLYHYTLNIDTNDPYDLEVEEQVRSDDTDPQVAFTVSATDDLSGIEHYEITIDGGKPIIWGDTEETGIFTPENTKPGSHSMEFKAVDKAGNTIRKELTFLVEALDPPLITEYSKRLLVGDPLIIRGETYPNAEVEAFVTYDGGEAKPRTITSDATGEFVVTAVDPVRSGEYKAWFEVTDRRGARSNSSETVTVTAEQPKILLFGSFVVSYLSLVVSLLVLLFLLAFLLWLGWYLWRRMRGRVGRETGEAQAVLHESFDDIRSEIYNHLEVLAQAGAKRKLTPEEDHIYRELSARLDEMEASISKEIEDIQQTAKIAPPARASSGAVKLGRAR